MFGKCALVFLLNFLCIIIAQLALSFNFKLHEQDYKIIRRTVLKIAKYKNSEIGKIRNLFFGCQC